jgi:transcriptional regulator with XRE-family HTH domain
MENPSPFTRLPESMELADIGPYFRGLREHYKLSEHDVSARLHIRVKYIQAIESSDISQLPGKVYARGYIATYAEFLGIDPEQAVERLLGTETKAKVEEYFVPEPMRLGAGTQRTIRNVSIALFVVALVYAWMQSPSDEENSTVVPIPDSLVESARSLVMPTQRSLRCVSGQTLAACVQAQHRAPDAHPMWYPDIFTANAPWKPAPRPSFDAPKPEPKPEPKPAPKKAPVKVDKPNPEQTLPWLQQQ